MIEALLTINAVLLALNLVVACGAAKYAIEASATSQVAMHACARIEAYTEHLVKGRLK